MFVNPKPREVIILEILAAGGHTKDIAAALHLSPATVKNYLSTLYFRLEATGQAHAVAIAFRKGWLR